MVPVYRVRAAAVGRFEAFPERPGGKIAHGPGPLAAASRGVVSSGDRPSPAARTGRGPSVRAGLHIALWRGGKRQGRGGIRAAPSARAAPPRARPVGRASLGGDPVNKYWILSTGAPWRDLPEWFGPWQSACDRFSMYRKDGTLDRILERLQMKLDGKGKIDWELFCVDGSSVRAHRAAAGAKRGGPHRPPRMSPSPTPWAVPAGAGAPSFTSSPTARGPRLRSA